MKKFFLIPVMFGIIIAGSFFNSCGNAEQKRIEQQDSIPNKKDSASESAYICPMGAECGKSDNPGKCASCGMELIKNDKKN